VEVAADIIARHVSVRGAAVSYRGAWLRRTEQGAPQRRLMQRISSQSRFIGKVRFSSISEIIILRKFSNHGLRHCDKVRS
jgi:hypothetical protein